MSLKIRIFEKYLCTSVYKSPQRQELRPQTSTLLLPHSITTMLSSFLAINALYSHRKKEQSN